MTPKVRKAAFFALLLALCGAVQAQEAVKALVGQKSREVQILCGPEQEKSLFFYGQNCYSSLALAPDAQKALADAAQKYLLQYDEKRLKKPGVKELLLDLVERFSKVEDWTAPALETVVKALSQGNGMGPWVHPIRVAVSGRGEGIGLFEMLQLLGKDTTLARLRHAAETLCA